MNRQIFFDKIREKPFDGSLGQPTVDGCNAILDEWERRGLSDLRHLAYMLATVRGECGVNMLPVREGFAKSDASARAYVSKQKYKYSVPVNGHVYYGRGLVQLTWDYNYRKMGNLLGVDLLNNPDLALSPPVASKIMFEGMIRGTFTGKKLSDYLNETITDWVNARRIVNGTDKAAQFAEWAKQFYFALSAATTVEAPKPIPIPPEPIKKPNTAAGAGAGTVVAGGGAVIVQQAQKQGASTEQLILAGALIAIIAVSVFIVVRNWRKK